MLLAHLVDEDDGWKVFPRHGKQSANKFLALPDLQQGGNGHEAKKQAAGK